MTEAPWELYLHQNIGWMYLPVPDIDYSKKLTQNDGGFFIRPLFNEETGTLKDYRDTLRLFMEASFSKVQVFQRSGAMPAMPWAEFLNHLEDFLNLYSLWTESWLARMQCPISIVKDEHIISTAILDRRACADAAKPEDITELINTDDVDREFKLRSDILHHSTPLSSPHTSPHILPVDPVNTTSIAAPLLPPAQLIPPVTVPRKRKASGSPPQNIESAQPAPLHRSTRQNQLPDSRAQGANAKVTNKRRRT
ncbi:hypothetical protein B0H14DRAFT_2620214 [Mycena olivaceomarginata]|nr:hypothetical protein B0H14DRAFT_2620214 [Mycena olivaceomarginata]